MKIIKISLISIVCLLLAALLCIVVMFSRHVLISSKINDEYNFVLNDTVYQTPASVEGVHFITQEITCGYAVIEMLANWQDKDITEQSLFADNGETISTSMGTGFLDEISKQFPEWNVTKHINLSNSELLKTMHKSLAVGMPVPIEFAALREKDGNQFWTLHFAVVTGMDIPSDSITVQNPYGYEEIYSIEEFLNATRYDSYENMELSIKFGFAFNMFHKNTIYILDNN